MKVDLISREETLQKFENIPPVNGLGLEPLIALQDVKEIINAVPEVDAVPVMHGKWIITGGMKPPEYHHHHQCSICESYAPMSPPYGAREMLTPHCPVCNAKMDLEEQIYSAGYDGSRICRGRTSIRPAVPLEPLCRYLEVYARTPIYNMRHTAEWWKEELEKEKWENWRVEQNASY